MSLGTHCAAGCAAAAVSPRTISQYTENFVLNGGVLLAALDARRPTRDIDFAARRLANDTTLMLGVRESNHLGGTVL